MNNLHDLTGLIVLGIAFCTCLTIIACIYIDRRAKERGGYYRVRAMADYLDHEGERGIKKQVLVDMLRDMKKNEDKLYEELGIETSKKR